MQVSNYASQQVHDTQDKVFEIAEAIRKLESDLDRYRVEDRRIYQVSKDQLLEAVQRCVSLNEQHIGDLRTAILEQGTKPKEESIKAGSSSSQAVLTAAVHFTGAADPTWIFDQFLQALRFNRIVSRYNNIGDAHDQTFDWIFKDLPVSDTLANIKTTLRKWLESDSRIYWLYGKPGSGKSTLMKYLCDNIETKERLQVWSGGNRVIMAQFYFWNSGDTLQKSQEGLLRSITFEILSQCPDLIPLACDTVDGFTHFDRDNNFWPSDTLLNLFTAVVNTRRVNLCLFIDGLDEFLDRTRTHQDLLKTLATLSSLPCIKMCVSSRPWTVFHDEFGAGAHLKLEDVTHDDIEQYVSDKFNEHSQFQTLMSRDPGYTRLVSEVVDRAQGVFLWVYLVVRTLLEGLTYHDSLSTLQCRLETFPPDLESFFQVLIDSVSPVYHRQMSRYFAIATTAGNPQAAMMYSFLDEVEDNAMFAMTLEHKAMDYGEILHRKDQLRRRLDGRSRGLLELEISELDSAIDGFFTCKVNFLHRTLRDFLFDYYGIHETFKQRLGEENPALTACYAILAQMKTAPFDYDDEASVYLVLVGKEQQMLTYIHDMFFFASVCLTAPNSEIELLNVLMEAEDIFHASADQYGWQKQETTFLGLASAIGFFPYVKRKLKTISQLPEAERTYVLSYDEALHLALRPTVEQPPKTAYAQRAQKEHLGATNRGFCRCISALLQAGANPNGTVRRALDPRNREGAWISYVFGLEAVAVSDRDAEYNIIDLLLSHGAYWDDSLNGKTVEMKLLEILGQELTVKLRDKFGSRTLRDDNVGEVSEKPKDKWHRTCDKCCLM
jgi:hypothetical protein